jgi:sugar phosphate isomerase/epimerase
VIVHKGQLRFGYGTSGFSCHRLGDALRVIANLGYEGVALTLDHQHLDPYAKDLARHVSLLSIDLDRLGLSLVIETGAGYLLDPWRRHSPTLLEPDREQRVDLLIRAVGLAADLGADLVSFSSGIASPGVPDTMAWERLVAGCEVVLARAEALNVRLAFEPDPDMFVSDLDGYDRLRKRLGNSKRFGLTLAIGRAEPQSAPDRVRRAGARLANVHLHDVGGAAPEELSPALTALSENGYRGLISVELPQHSHAAPAAAGDSLGYLRQACGIEVMS